MDKSTNLYMQAQLCNLRTISKVEEGQSLDTTKKLSIYSPNIWNWAWRKYYGDNKTEVVRTLHDTYGSIAQSAAQLISEIEIARDEWDKLIDTAISLAECIKASIKGISNMIKTTYRAYPETVSSLESVVIDIAIVTYKQLIGIIPENKLTKSLKENITLGSIIVFEKRSISDSPKLEENQADD